MRCFAFNEAGVSYFAYEGIILQRKLITNTEFNTMLWLEDDVVLCENFKDKVSNVLGQVKKIEERGNSTWDIIFLGHFLYPKYRTEHDFNQNIPMKIK